jgi:hypothetical protein
MYGKYANLKSEFTLTGERTIVEKIPVIVPRREIEKLIDDGQFGIITLITALQSAYSRRIFNNSRIHLQLETGNWIDLDEYRRHDQSFKVIRPATPDEIDFWQGIETARQSYFVQKLNE